MSVLSLRAMQYFSSTAHSRIGRIPYGSVPHWNLPIDCLAVAKHPRDGAVIRLELAAHIPK
jgi:hypothetical protein